MNIVSRVVLVSIMMFLGGWAGSVLAYDNNLYWKVSKLEKESWSLSKNLNRSHLYRSRSAVNDARNLARAAKSLKWAVKNNQSQRLIHRKFTTLRYRYDHLMRYLGYRDRRYYGYRERHIGHHIRRVQNSFHAAFRAFNGRGYYYNRRDRRYPYRYY